MTDKEVRLLTSKLKLLIKKWIKSDALCLKYWHLSFVFEREPSSEHADANAFCISSWRYQRATIVFNLPNLTSFADDELEHIFLHEVMHVVLAELELDDGKDEHIATTLATMLATIVGKRT